MTAAMPPALTVEILASLRADHIAQVQALHRQCRDLGDQLDAERRANARLRRDIEELADSAHGRSETVYDAARDWLVDDTGIALAADNVRLRAEVARLQSMLADLGGPLAVTAADCGSPGRSAEVASSDVTEAA